MSASAIPYRRNAPAWVKMSAEEMIDQILKYSKKGLTPSQIGVVLRDVHSTPLVKQVTGNKILRILKSKGQAPDIPEDLYYLIKKAVAVRKHLERSRKDYDAKFRLILIEARIARLVRYYKRTGQVAPTFKYGSSSGATLVS